MDERPDAFDKLDEPAEQDVEQYEGDQGVVDDLVAQAEEIIQNEDNHEYYREMAENVGLADTESLLEMISIPSKEVHSAELSAALIRISNLQCQGGGDLKNLKGNISSALLMKLDAAYPKHWEIRLGHQTFSSLFYNMSGTKSLHIADCSGPEGGIGMGVENVEYICFEDIKGFAGQNMRSVGTALFKEIDGPEPAGLHAEMRNAVFLDVSQVGAIGFENTIFYDVSEVLSDGWEWENNQPITAYIRQEGLSPIDQAESASEFRDFETPIKTILYDPTTGIDVPEDAAETVRPLTDEEYQHIAALADGPPPNKNEVEDVVARLAKGVGQDE